MTRGISVVIALMVLVAAPSASLAASKSKRSNYSDPTKCTGGACTASNPDRVVTRGEGPFFKKKSNKKPSSSSSTNH
jgi:hypothetical protein